MSLPNLSLGSNDKEMSSFIGLKHLSTSLNDKERFLELFNLQCRCIDEGNQVVAKKSGSIMSSKAHEEGMHLLYAGIFLKIKCLAHYFIQNQEFKWGAWELSI